MSKSNLENSMDKQLKIQTTGRDDSKEDTYHHPYEPTPYSVLERLAGSEYITRDNILVQAGSAMLAQANTKTQSVMRLLG